MTNGNSHRFWRPSRVPCCTALAEGNLPVVRTVQETVKGSTSFCIYVSNSSSSSSNMLSFSWNKILVAFIKFITRTLYVTSCDDYKLSVQKD